MTRLDHPSVNGKPEALLFVTPAGDAYNAHTVGVWWEPETARWTIYNEDREPLPEGVAFNVVAIDPSSSNAFTHTTSPENTIDYYTMISHPASDFDSEAALLITPNWNDAYVPGPLGVWFDGERWSVYRQDKAPLAPGVRFNVLVVDQGMNTVSGESPFEVKATTHRAVGTNTKNHITKTNETDPDDVIFLTHNWGESGPYNRDVPGVWHDGDQWNIVNHGAGKIAFGATFNCFVFDPSDASPQSMAAIDRRMGWMKIRNDSSLGARFTLTYTLDGQTHIASSGTMQPGEMKNFRVPMRATSLKLTGQVTDGKTVRNVVDDSFAQIPNETYAVTGTLAKPKVALVPGEGL